LLLLLPFTGPAPDLLGSSDDLARAMAADNRLTPGPDAVPADAELGSLLVSLGDSASSLILIFSLGAEVSRANDVFAAGR